MNKVLLLIDNLGSGGAQNQMCLLARGLQKMNIDLELIYYQDDDFFLEQLDQHQIGYKLIKKKSKYDFGFFLNLRKYVRDEKFNTIISFLRTPNLLNVLVKRFNKDIRSIVSYRSLTQFNQLSTFDRLSYSFINKHADHIVANSYHEKQNWLDQYPDLSHKFSSIYNAVDDAKFFPSTQVSKRKGKILIIGSISPMKNGLVVLEALKKLRDRYKPAIKVNWYGRIDKNIPSRISYADKMMDYIKANKLNDWIQIHPPVKDVKTLYLEHDALLLASVIEGLPNVVCEALSCAKPVLLSDGLDHKLIISNAKEGFLFDASIADQIADRIQELYSLSDDEYLKMSEAADLKAKDLFNYSDYINSYMQLIESE